MSAIIVIAYSATVLLVMARAGEPSEVWWWIGALPFLAWCGAPIVAPLFFRSWIITIGVEIIALWGIYEYNLQLFGSGARSTSALAFIFLPIYQWLAVLVLVPIDWLTRKIAKG